MSATTEDRIVAAEPILRDLRRAQDLPTVYHKGQLLLTGFKKNSLSCTGFTFLLGGGVISSAAVLQKLVAQSSEGAELIALHAASHEGAYNHESVREEWGGVQIATFKLQSDSESALRTRDAVVTHQAHRNNTESLTENSI